MTALSRRLRPILVDWRAAILAGLAAGTLFLILNLLIVPEAVNSSTEGVLRTFASIILGPETLGAGTGFGLGITITAIALHYLLSILAALLIAFVVHRWGIIGGTIGGAILGAAIYLINMYTFTSFFPWVFSMDHEIFLTMHIIFGAATGALYEIMERDEYEERQGERLATR